MILIPSRTANFARPDFIQLLNHQKSVLYVPTQQVAHNTVKMRSMDLVVLTALVAVWGSMLQLLAPPIIASTVHLVFLL
jgi:hypothetical protein